jgi:hypothetical protein
MKFGTNPDCIKEICILQGSEMYVTNYVMVFPIVYVDKKTHSFFILALFGIMPSVVSCTLNFCSSTS